MTYYEQPALEPCPFCRGGASVFHHTPRGMEPSWHIECELCGCGTCHHETKEQAIAAWNCRPLPAFPGDVAGIGAEPLGEMQKCPNCGVKFQKVHDVDAHMSSLLTPPGEAK